MMVLCQQGLEGGSCIPVCHETSWACLQASSAADVGHSMAATARDGRIHMADTFLHALQFFKCAPPVELYFSGPVNQPNTIHVGCRMVRQAVLDSWPLGACLDPSSCSNLSGDAGHCLHGLNGMIYGIALLCGAHCATWLLLTPQCWACAWVCAGGAAVYDQCRPQVPLE